MHYSRLSLLMISLFLLPTISYSQNCGSYPCSGVTLASRVDVATLGGGKCNDIWGVSAGFTEYAIVGLDNGTAFVDISNPNSPTVIGVLPAPAAASTWRDIRVNGGYAYIVSEAVNSDIQMFDLSRLDTLSQNPSASLPVTFDSNGSADISFAGRAHNIVTNLNSNSHYIFTVGTSGHCSGGMTVYDVLDPANPVQVNCYPDEGYSHDMLCIYYKGADVNYIGKEICIGFNDNYFSILDATDKTDIQFLSRGSHPGAAYVHQGWVTDDHRYLLVDDELDEGPNINMKTHIFDIQNLGSPAYIGTFDHGFECIDHNMFIKGPYAYQANYESGLRILDISDVANGNLSTAGYFDIMPSGNSANFNGAWGVYPFLPSGNIIVSGINDVGSDASGGLFVMQPQLPHILMRPSGNDIKTICPGETVNFIFSLSRAGGFNSTVNFTVENLSPGLTANIGSSANSVAVSISNTGNMTTNESFTIKATPTDNTPSSEIGAAIILAPTPSASSLLIPADEAELTDLDIDMIWIPDANSDHYTIEIARDVDFSSIIETASNLTTNQYQPQNIEFSNQYYWRVTGFNDCGDVFSDVFSFTTKNTNPLPVELLSFNGEVKKQFNLLKWETTSEINNRGFFIERADDFSGRNFESIGWHDALSANGARYEFKDETIESGRTYYYRLAQQDFDGTLTYSDIIELTTSITSPIFAIYPNPMKDLFSVRLLLPSNQTTTVTLSLIDVTGRQVRSFSIPVDSGRTDQEVDISDLPNGVYFLQMIGEGMVETERIVKRG